MYRLILTFSLVYRISLLPWLSFSTINFWTETNILFVRNRVEAKETVDKMIRM